MEEEIKGTNPYRRILYGVIALIILIGFIYSSGIYQYLLYQRTPSSAQQEPIESALNVEQLIIPLQVFILQNEEGNGSVRAKEDVQHLVTNASEIWSQAGVVFEIKEIQEIQKTNEEIDLLLQNITQFQRGIPGLDKRYIHVFLVSNLKGINGVSFSGLNTVAVADYTSVYDFRVLAHEIGHVLGLNHTPDTTGRLMYQGANGFTLTLEEIVRARTRAEAKF